MPEASAAGGERDGSSRGRRRGPRTCVALEVSGAQGLESYVLGKENSGWTLKALAVRFHPGIPKRLGQDLSAVNGE